MTRPLSRYNPIRAHARAAWMAAFEKALVERIPSVRGRVDWDTASYLYGQGLRVVDGRITLAARRAFASADEARRYADTVASTRRPFVVADVAVALIDSLGTNLNSKES